MSDLSQPALAVLPDEAAAFAWPMPDLAGYPAPGPLGHGPACRIEGLNGRAIEGHLLRFDPTPGLLQLRTAGVAKSVSLRFDQFRRLCLLDPVPALEAPGDARDLASERPQMPFRVEFGNGNLWQGRTVGQREEAWGLFLFEPLDERGSVRRWFVPRPAYVEAEVGLRIGEALIAQRSATPDQIASALAEQDLLRTRKLGDLLLERHIITAAELAAAIDHQARMPMVRIGEALTGLGLITEAQLQEALELQRQDRGVPLGELLVRQGAVTRADLQTALARKMGYPLVDVLLFPADAEAVARLPYAVASRVPALPLLLRGGRLVVAVEDPSNRTRLDELEFAAQCKVVPVLVRSGVLQAAVDRAYEKIGAANFALRLPGDPAAPIDYEMGDASRLLASMESGADPRADEDDGSVIEQSDNTLVRLINSMIVEAHTQGVSDIHIECTGGREKVRIRFRKDGQLRPYLELPPSYRSAIIARLKIMCDLDISERRKPQDGKINFAKFVQGVRLELRVATIPTQNNLEDAVLRLLASNRPIPLDQLGLAPAILERVRETAQRPHGLLLCVGPTGSGKTTTLHSVLSSINSAERKLWTAEDPIEITQQGLRQVQVNPRIDWTFAKALRAFLRADPDVIMVGEIRDQETAQVAIEASLTGHLVLSTLHTNSAPETVTRLLDMGMDPFNFADALLGVLAQRLVRRLCMQCRSETDASPQEEDELLQDYLHAMDGAENPPGADAVRADWRARFGRKVAADGTRSGPLARYRCAGCEQCSGSGYRGRAAIHELMMVSRGLRHLIQTSSRADDLERHALGEGLRTLRQDGIEKVLAGLTSIEEVRANS